MKKIQFKSSFSSIKGRKPVFKRGDILDAYVLFESSETHPRTLVYVPAHKKLYLASEYERWKGIWRADSGYGAFDFRLGEEAIKTIDKILPTECVHLPTECV